MQDLAFRSLTDIARAITARELSPLEVVEATMQRIAAVNPVLNAFISINEQALDEARAAESALQKGRAGPLTGIPISLKDLILTRRGLTTAGSRIFGEGLPSDHDALVVQRLRRAGAVIAGKNNLHELALGVTNVNAHFGPARNPWDPARVAGGSSGGSCVAVAAGLGYGSIGSDTRGSIRIPAACCGVTGLKPTYGLVPVTDVIPLAWSLDHVGPIARSVADISALLSALVGGRAAAGYSRALSRPVEGLKMGICEYFLRDLDPEIEQAVQAAIEVFRQAGVTIRDVALPELEGSHGSSALITVTEAATYHEQGLRERPDGIGTAVRERLEGAHRYTAVDRVRAERHQVAVTQAFDRAFEEVDILIGATLPAFPTVIGTDALTIRGRETNLLAEFPRLTAPANLGGVPALSLPAGFGAAGLPIGLQLMAARNDEESLLTAGACFQSRTEWHLRQPTVSAIP